jgi:hypothetical protein
MDTASIPYADFTRSGATYTPFPDPRSHRIRLEDLRDSAVRESETARRAAGHAGRAGSGAGGGQWTVRGVRG